MATGMLTPFRSRELVDPDTMIRPFQILQHEMTRLFEGFLLGGLGLPPSEISDGDFLIPRMEMRETDKELRLTVELPGVAERDIKVQIQNDDTLTIRAEKKCAQEEEGEATRFSERSFGMFQRTMQLPFPVPPHNVKARFENGVLSILLPRPTAQPSSMAHSVPIETSPTSGGSGRIQAESPKPPAMKTPAAE